MTTTDPPSSAAEPTPPVDPNLDPGAGDLTTQDLGEGAVTAPVTPRALVVGGRSIWMIEDARGRLVREQVLKMRA